MLHVQGSMVEVIWRTDAPYESVVQCSSGGAAVLEGLTLRHYSKSVVSGPYRKVSFVLLHH